MKRMTFNIDDSGEEAFKILEEDKQYKRMSRTGIILTLVEDRAADLKNGNGLMTKNDLLDALDGISLGSRVGRPRKEKEEPVAVDPLEEQKRLCSLLGGGVDPDGYCVYTKYEINASGRPIDNLEYVKIANVTTDTVARQYEPTKDFWEKAKKEWVAP